jgi:Glycoside hydrolase 123 N-terminal domain
MALFSWQLSRRKFLAGGTLLSGLTGAIAGRIRAFARVGENSALPRNPDDPSSSVRTNAATGAGIKVWAINDTVRVDPIRNRPFEENPSLFPDGIRPGYKQSNLVWDGPAQRITLKAARNETVAFQIVIERTGAKLTSVNVALADLAGPSGARIPLENFDMFREWYVHVKNPSKQSYTLGAGWYPDGLLPCLRWSGNLYPHTYVMPFDLPDPLNNVGKEQQSQAIWVDIYVPRSRQAAPPGRYTAPITISSDQGSTQLTLELQLWDFELPEESYLKPSIHTDTEINTFSEELEVKYYQLARKHRISISCLGYAPALKVSGTNVEIDWSRYDARLSKYFDGSAFTRQYGYSGPGYGVPTEYIVLPFDAYPWNLYKIPRGIQLSGKEWKFYAPWPVATPREGPTPEFRAIWKNAFQAYQAHFDQHPAWNKTEMVVFFNSLDESYDRVSRDRMFYFGQLLKESNTPRLKYRVDGSYPRETTKRLEKILDIANLGLEDCTPANAAEFKKHGIELWYYENGASYMDGDGLKCRGLSWFAWKQRTDSWDIWEMDFDSLRAWQYPETYNHQNGAGMLVYRGETMGLDEPAASIRFKGMRRGSQDYEYFWLLAQTPGGRQAVDEAVQHVVHGPFNGKESLGAPGMWLHDPDEWDRMRLKIGDAIEKAQASHA